MLTQQPSGQLKMILFICLFVVYLFIYLFIWLFIFLFIYLFIYLFVYLFVCLFICLFIYLFIYLFINILKSNISYLKNSTKRLNNILESENETQAINVHNTAAVTYSF